MRILQNGSRSLLYRSFGLACFLVSLSSFAQPEKDEDGPRKAGAWDPRWRDVFGAPVSDSDTGEEDTGDEVCASTSAAAVAADSPDPATPTIPDGGVFPDPCDPLASYAEAAAASDLQGSSGETPAASPSGPFSGAEPPAPPSSPQPLALPALQRCRGGYFPRNNLPPRSLASTHQPHLSSPPASVSAPVLSFEWGGAPTPVPYSASVVLPTISGVVTAVATAAAAAVTATVESSYSSTVEGSDEASPNTKAKGRAAKKKKKKKTRTRCLRASSGLHFGWDDRDRDRDRDGGGPEGGGGNPWLTILLGDASY